MDNINPIPAVITNNMTIGMITTNEINVKWSPVKYITAMSMINEIRKLTNSEHIPPKAKMYLGTNILFKIPLLPFIEFIAVFVAAL